MRLIEFIGFGEVGPFEVLFDRQIRQNAAADVAFKFSHRSLERAGGRFGFIAGHQFALLIESGQVSAMINSLWQIVDDIKRRRHKFLVRE